MVIIIRWKGIFLSLVALTFTSILTFYFKPTLLAPFSSTPHTRRLMNSEGKGGCKTLEDQIDRMHDLIQTKEKVNEETVERLRAQIMESRRRLDVQYGIVKDLERRNRQLIDRLSGFEIGSRRREDDYRLAPQIRPDMIRLLNIKQKSEFAVIPFTAFSKDRLYQLESGMINKPEVIPIGNKKAEFENVTRAALQVLNKDNVGRQYQQRDLVQGYYRIDRMAGTQYELFYKSLTAENVFEHVQIFRPFAPLQTVQLQSYDKSKEWINLIVPLSGRVETFVQFMEMFVEQCINNDGRVFLTIVYFGEEGKEEVLEILKKTAEKHNYDSYRFIERDESFSRGVGLLAGAEAWIDGNVLLFFCDVDVTFRPGFLDRCRLNSTPGSKVYYPIVFSLYNPSIVYSDSGVVPSWREQLKLKRDNGFWRTFGFGMTCMYRSDFLFMRGFDTKIQGWGMEDVKLYRKLAQSNLNIIRAPDPGIFHMWHEKSCDPHLPLIQYNMCLGSKALGEASHVQLGMLAFRHLKEENEQLHEEEVERKEDADAPVDSDVENSNPEEHIAEGFNY
jgi:chondroitin sulfate N-acetylgalactosaminyltransferase 1/2